MTATEHLRREEPSLTVGVRNVRTALWALALSWLAGSAVQLGVVVHELPFDLEAAFGVMVGYQLFSIPLAVWSVLVVVLAVLASARSGRRWIVVVVSLLAALIGLGLSIVVIVQLTLIGSDTTTFSTLPETVVALAAFHLIAWGVFAAAQSVAPRSHRPSTHGG